MIHIEDVQILHHKDEFLEASIQLMEQTSRYIRIRSAMLDPELFDNADFNEALSAFARRSRFSEVQILVDYPNRIMERGHRTLELMRRLSEKIIIKQFYDDPNEDRDSFIISDQRGILIKNPQPNTEGYFSLTDSVYTKTILEGFEHDWQMSPKARHLLNMII